MMATKDECKKCSNKKDCPILYAINAEHIKADEILRKKCMGCEEK